MSAAAAGRVPADLICQHVDFEDLLTAVRKGKTQLLSPAVVHDKIFLFSLYAVGIDRQRVREEQQHVRPFGIQQKLIRDDQPSVLKENIFAAAADPCCNRIRIAVFQKDICPLRVQPLRQRMKQKTQRDRKQHRADDRAGYTQPDYQQNSGEQRKHRQRQKNHKQHLRFLPDAVCQHLARQILQIHFMPRKPTRLS